MGHKWVRRVDEAANWENDRPALRHSHPFTLATPAVAVSRPGDRDTTPCQYLIRNTSWMLWIVASRRLPVVLRGVEES